MFVGVKMLLLDVYKIPVLAAEGEGGVADGARTVAGGVA